MSKRTRALKDELYDLYPKLTPTAAAALDKMIAYLKLKNIGAYHRLSVQCDIAQMLLEAEAQGRSIEDVLGTDHRAFCDAIVGALPQPTLRERRLRMGRDGIGGLALGWALAFLVPVIQIYLTYSSVPGVWEVAKEYYGVTTSVPFTVLQVLLLMVLSWACARISVTRRRWQANVQFSLRRKVLYYVAFFALLYVINIGSHWVQLPDFLTEPLFMMPLAVNVAVQVVLVGAFFWLNEHVDEGGNDHEQTDTYR